MSNYLKSLKAKSKLTKMLIALVGVDCSGKTTQINRLIKYYNSINIAVNAISLKYKPTVLNLTQYESKFLSENNFFPAVLSPDHYAIAYCCDFFNHYSTNILPLLNENKKQIILSDRYTICYKAFAHAIKAKDNISHTFLDRIIIEPDLTICLDLSIAEVMKRISLRKEERAKDETYEILDSLIKYYRKDIRNITNGYVLNANVSIASLTKSIINLIDKNSNE